MHPLRSILLVLGILVPCYCMGAPGPTSLTFHFDHNEKEYSLHVLVPAHLRILKNDFDFFANLFQVTRGRVPGPWKKDSIIELLESWVADYYRQIGLYPPKPNSRLDGLLRNTNSLRFGRTGAVFVTPRDDPFNILALVRIDVTSKEHPELGIEAFLKHHKAIKEGLPREPRDAFHCSMERKSYRLVIAEQGAVFRFTEYDAGHAIRPPGGIAELQNFIRVPGSEDFIPLLYLTAESLGLTHWSGERSQGWLVGINHYYAHCEGEVRRTYYEGMGWSVIETYPNPYKPNTKNYVLAITREKFKSELEATILRRKAGFEILTKPFVLDGKTRNSKVCSRVLEAWGGL